MPFCPECKCEYRDDVTVCSDCNVPLISELPITKDDCSSSDSLVFLCSLDDGIKGDMTISFLENNDIPVIKKSRGAGEYLKIYMGMSAYGVDIFVPSELYVKASEILSAEPFVEREEETEECTITDDGYKGKQRVKAWIIILLLTPGIIWFMASIVIRLLNRQ